MRAKYMDASLQNVGDNTKDRPDWVIYPRPPQPSHPPRPGEIIVDDAAKADHESFSIKDCQIPSADKVSIVRGEKIRDKIHILSC